MEEITKSVRIGCPWVTAKKGAETRDSFPLMGNFSCYFFFTPVYVVINFLKIERLWEL
jgi:hypothetical protein